MYIEPQSKIRLLSGVPIDSTYTHTLWFSTPENQVSYMMGQTKKVVSDSQYQRVNSGTAKVGFNASEIYDVNYMMFQNTAYGTKWFYAFVQNVEYINDKCSIINYVLDDMQTWLFDAEIGDCFVEREHSITDAIGDNLIPESLDVGEYVFNGYERMTEIDGIKVIVAVSETEEAANGNRYDGVYGGATLYVFDDDDISGINEKIGEYLVAPDAIVSIYTCAGFSFGSIPSDHLVTSKQFASHFTFTDSPISTQDTLDGYMPKNNKLYTYPYNYFHIDNAAGSSLSLRYEFFDQLKPKLQVYSNITQPVSVVASPMGYKNLLPINITDPFYCLNTVALELTGYPMCSWNVDAYKAWLAQNSVPLIGNSLASLAGAGMGAIATGNPAPLAMTALSQITGVMNQGYKASISADIQRGNFNNGSVNVSANKQTFFYGRASVTSQIARTIDDYFTMFGYATKRIKVPNRNGRSRFNFVKTAYCSINGNIPADALRHLEEIYNAGITFWKDWGNVGNYTLANEVP